MSLKQEQNKEEIQVENEIKTLALEQKFLSDFIQYYHEIQLNCKRTKNISKICESLSESSTVNFLEKWGNVLDFIRSTSTYLKWPYFSFEMHLADRIILLPHRAVVYEVVNPDSLIDSQLKHLKTLSEFKIFLTHVFKNLNVSLNWNDLKIITGLTSKSFLNRSTPFPTAEKMAELCGIPRQTFNRRFELLTVSLSVIYLNFRIDIGKLGYETFFAIIPQDWVNKDFSNYQQYLLAIIPLDSLSNMMKSELGRKLVIFQIPIHRNEIFRFFIDKISDNVCQQLSHGYIGWNIATMHPKIAKRWKIAPPILKSQIWTDQLISEGNGISYNLNPQEYFPTLTPTELKCLSYFERYGFVQSKRLAENLEVETKTIKETWRRINQRKLMHRFVYIANIGLDFKPWITIIGDYQKHSPEFIHKIIEHLKFFPFSYLYYNEGDSKTQSLPLITGLLYMPPEWIDAFFHKFSLLTEYGFNIQISFAHNRVIKQNINLLGTY